MVLSKIWVCVEYQQRDNQSIIQTLPESTESRSSDLAVCAAVHPFFEIENYLKKGCNHDSKNRLVTRDPNAVRECKLFAVTHDVCRGRGIASGHVSRSCDELLSKYGLTVSGKSFTVGQFSQITKQYEHLGYITFEDGRLAYISRSLDTSAWPRDEGFSVGRAIYDALSGSITRTDSNGAKRTNAQIIISNQDGFASAPVNLRTISIYVEDRKIVVLIADGADGKSVSAQVDISAKPW
jgi:hypothetical protein